MAKITINEDYLVGQQKRFARLDADSYVLVSGPLKEELPLRTGGEKFIAGGNLKKAAKYVRENFHLRATSFNEQSSFLEVGIRSLLDNSDRIESLNSVTAEDFTYYVEETATAPRGGPGAGAPSTPTGEKP